MDDQSKSIHSAAPDSILHLLPRLNGQYVECTYKQLKKAFGKPNIEGRINQCVTCLWFVSMKNVGTIVICDWKLSPLMPKLNKGITFNFCVRSSVQLHPGQLRELESRITGKSINEDCDE